jgi:hypothetical protein
VGKDNRKGIRWRKEIYMFAHVTHDEVSLVSSLMVLGFAFGAYFGFRMLKKIFGK